ncbi:S-adenosylmethionine decarboxylase [Stieleria sp. TO1_6]|uniref:S-adenosylmethionine decarboxylase family protein n=1 Tax=Stieleria tagensis TaxID=2956795 RepID=UPI00209AAE56|nr:S-adenosylmethionine decarboxylase [Stieleria tagensis]MCO8122808.1 S-adenosylmethionine decarboxylase [Stieleria tagensis]
MDRNPVESKPLDGFAGGTEWVVDVSGCPADRLVDLDLILAVCDQIVADLGLSVVGNPLRHAFPGHGGVTAMYLLSESHLACHTYPEFGFATFNLYCCRQRAVWNWDSELRRQLGCSDVVVRQLERQVMAFRQEARR